MKVVANLICQNGLKDIMRCIESVFPVVDEYYVMDGGSTDGTWECLLSYRRAYHLTLFQSPFESMDKQRNKLLEKTPKDCWIINIDQDEKLNIVSQYGMRDYIARITPEVYEDPKRVSPIVIGMPFYNLIQDPLHHSENPVRVNVNKIFYYDNNLHFVDKYHSRLVYNEDDPHYQQFPAPSDWGIFHYAFLDEARVERAKEEITSGKRDYGQLEWNLDLKPIIKISDMII